MTGETVYLMIPQITEVYEREVYVKDIGKVHCRDSAVAAKVRSVKVTSFKNAGKKGASFVGNILELVKKIEEIDSNIEVNNLGESDFVVKFRPSAAPNRLLQWLKTAAVAAASFCGAAFAIMTFNNDASVTEVFGNVYKLVMGTEADGVTILELSYSAGLAAGILVFFNHFASWKITVDPTPIEVEMRLYEENINKTLIINDGRKESGIDVS